MASHCEVIHKLVRKDPRLLLAVVCWLYGYTRYDIYTTLGIDLDELRKFNIVIDEFRETAKIRDETFRRYDIDEIVRLVLPCLDVNEIIALILPLCTIDELKILAYVADYVLRMNKFSIYGVSDYVRCTELLESVNVEYKVLSTVQKYLVYACDKTYSCTEYPWTQEMLNKLLHVLKHVANIPSDEDIIHELEKILDRQDGLNVLAAMYSMSTGSIDQFQVFHRRRLQEFLKDVNLVRYVYFNGFLNGLAVPLIEKVIERRVIRPIVESLSLSLGVYFHREVEDLYKYVYVSDDGMLKVVAPKLYYMSPIFWAMPNAINILYEVPPCPECYVKLYRPYFEHGFLVISKGSSVVKIFCFEGCDESLKLRLSQRYEIVEV